MVPAPVWTDLKTFRAGIFRGYVDILTGGYPCQPFSTAGKRRGDKDPRHLWPHIVRIIQDCRPRWVFLENVEGHLTKGVVQVLSDLEKMAYRPVAGVFSAEECGAPHQRKRVFILAYSRDSRSWGESGSVECPAWAEVLRQGVGPEHSVWPHPAGADSELGNAESDNKRGPSITAMHREGIQVGRSGSHVADTGGSEPNRLSEPAGRRGNRAAWQPGVELDYNTGYGLERRGKLGGQDQGRSTPKRVGYDPAGCRCFLQRWPARPGEFQYPWEEPRVVADNQRRISERGPGTGTGRGKREPEQAEKTLSRGQGHDGPGKVKPKLGRAVNGPSNRVDRLRLLGNGVVPATAEKAWRILYGEIINAPT